MVSLLTEGLDKLNLTYTQAQLEKMNKFLDEIRLFNPIYKLVSYEDEDVLIIKHFLDCLAAVNVIKENLKEGILADLGSGGGFPGILLAIMLEDNEIYLVERMKRRVDFLNNVVLACGLKNVHIIQEDIKAIDKQFDLITCRAFHPIYDIIEDVDRLLKEDGLFCAYKGRKSYIAAELENIKKFKANIVDLKVPFLDESRSMCILSRGC